MQQTAYQGRSFTTDLQRNRKLFPLLKVRVHCLGKIWTWWGKEPLNMTGIIHFVRCFLAVEQYCRTAENVTAMSLLHLSCRKWKDDNYAMLTSQIPISQRDHLYQTERMVDNKTKLEEHKRCQTWQAYISSSSAKQCCPHFIQYDKKVIKAKVCVFAMIFLLCRLCLLVVFVGG